MQSPLGFQKYITISVGRLLICTVLQNSQNWQIVQDDPTYNQCDLTKVSVQSLYGLDALPGANRHKHAGFHIFFIHYDC